MDANAGVFPIDWGQIQKLLGRQHCVECDHIMRADDWLRQKDIIYIWYRCSNNQCKGSRLEKLVKASDK